MQSTKRVSILDGAGVLSMGRVRERFDASHNRIANRIADNNLPAPHEGVEGVIISRGPFIARTGTFLRP